MNVLLRNQRQALRLGLLNHSTNGSCSKKFSTLRYRSILAKKYNLNTPHDCLTPHHYALSSVAVTNYAAHNPCASSHLGSYHQAIRTFRLDQRLFEHSSSKVEETVKTIKNKKKELEEESKKESALKDATRLAGGIHKSPTPVEDTKPAVVKKSLRAKIWDELVHYYHGFRLLFIDINICRKLLWRVLNGKTLTRRENNLLVRTTSDLFRLIPFSVFIIVPFMELLLPLFIKFFPGMLPSTFQTKKDHEDKLKQSLQVRLEMAKFLQRTLDEMSVQHKEHESEEAKQFVEFFRKIKDPNEYVSNEEIIKHAKHFQDEITLDSLSREQLAALCRVLELNTMGTTNFLRFQLRYKLRSIAADDRAIEREGVSALDLYELQQACKARGMRAYGLSADRLRAQLQEWIDLSLNEKVPMTLILLSRAMLYSDSVTTTDKLKETIRVLPDVVAAQTEAAIGEREGKIDNKAKIASIKAEELKIKQEREEEREEIKQALSDASEHKADMAEELKDTAPIISDEAPCSKQAEEKIMVSQDNTESITKKDVELLSEALKTLSTDKKMFVEKEAIKELKEELQDYKEDIEELREVRSETQVPVRETRAAKLLFKKVNTMISKLDDVMQNLENKSQEIQKEIVNPEGDKEMTPVQQAQKQRQEELVRIDELVNIIKGFKKTSADVRLKTIETVLSKIDADRDGAITVEEVINVIETIGRENVNLNAKQVEELVDVLEKEHLIEAEERIEKAILKHIKEANELKDSMKLDELKVEVDKATAAAAAAMGVDPSTLEDKARSIIDKAAALADKAPILTDKAPECTDANKNVIDPSKETKCSSSSSTILSQAPPQLDEVQKSNAAGDATTSPLSSTAIPPTVGSVPPKSVPKDKMI